MRFIFDILFPTIIIPKRFKEDEWTTKRKFHYINGTCLTPIILKYYSGKKNFTLPF